MTQPISSPPICARCGQPLPSADALACAHCGSLVHAETLAQLAAEAKWQMQYNPARAIGLATNECTDWAWPSWLSQDATAENGTPLQNQPAAGP